MSFNRNLKGNFINKETIMNKSKATKKTNAEHHEHHGGTTVTGKGWTGNKTSKPTTKRHEHEMEHTEKVKLKQKPSGNRDGRDPKKSRPKERESGNVSE